MEKWALMQEPASTTWWSIGRGTCMEVVRNRETHAGRSAAVKMIMASQIMGPHLSSSNSLSNHTALRLQQPTPLSSRVFVEPTRRNCPAYRAGKAPPSTFNYAKIVRACSFYINTVLLYVYSPLVSRSRRVVTLNREFLFFNATYTN